MSKILLVNGIIVPEPTGMKPTEQDITKSQRSTTGYMRSHIVRHDVHTLECKWSILSANEYYVLAQAIKNKIGLKVFYHLPDRNQEAELTMYVGDRTKDVLLYRNGKPVYKNVAIKFIEE